MDPLLHLGGKVLTKDSLSANHYLDDLSGPVQLHHATGDLSVPVEFSDDLAADLEARGGAVDYHRYEGDDHNIAANFGPAMRETIAFFDAQLKGDGDGGEATD